MDLNVVQIIISSATLLCMLIFVMGISSLFSDILNKLKRLDPIFKENETLKSENRKLLNKLPKIYIGDQVMCFEYPLEWTADKEKFSADFKCEVMEVSDSRVKVKAIDFSTDNKKANEPSNRSGMIRFMNDRWLKISEVELIHNTRKNRDVKLDQILETN